MLPAGLACHRRIPFGPLFSPSLHRNQSGRDGNILRPQRFEMQIDLLAVSTNIGYAPARRQQFLTEQQRRWDADRFDRRRAHAAAAGRRLHLLSGFAVGAIDRLRRAELPCESQAVVVEIDHDDLGRHPCNAQSTRTLSPNHALDEIVCGGRPARQLPSNLLARWRELFVNNACPDKPPFGGGDTGYPLTKQERTHGSGFTHSLQKQPARTRIWNDAEIDECRLKISRFRYQRQIAGQSETHAAPMAKP